MFLKYVGIIVLLSWTVQASPQFKTKIQTGNLVNNSTPPHEPYHGPVGGHWNFGGNQTANFVNKTQMEMAKGICYKEVPTVSLLKNHRGEIPAGNGTNPSMSRIQVCCDGYQRNVHNFRKCDPVCLNECINGLCVAPNKCECYPDHIRNIAGFCIATCPIGCGNGECLPDKTCACKPGYTLDSSLQFCVPKCSKGCQNGNCTAPEVCSCIEGFELTSEKVCAPKCSGGCGNGECVRPEVCVCLPGFEKIDKFCEPICTRGCGNGRCVSPDVCSCESGWELDRTGTTCQPYCQLPCLNGFCSGPNSCSCHRGYILDEYNPTRCVPNCPNGCPNGVCSGPNLCICNAGFVKDRSLKGSQACVRRT